MKFSKLSLVIFLIPLIILANCHQNVVDDKPIQVVNPSMSRSEDMLLCLINNGIRPLFWKGDIAVLDGGARLRRDKEGYYVHQQQIHPGITLLDLSGVVLQPDDWDWDILIILDDKKLAVVNKYTAGLSVFPIPRSE